MEADCPSATNEAGRAAVCNGCSGQALCSASRDEPSDKALSLRMGAIRRKVLVMSGKGGVGKSTVAAQLAASLARGGRRVGLLDLDLCGPSLAQMLGVAGKRVEGSAAGWMPVKPDGFDGRLSVMSIAFLLDSDSSAVIWRGPRKHSTVLSFLRDVYWSKLDYLICDTPPGTSDEHMTVVTALKDIVDGAILVSTPSAVAVSTLGKELDFCKKLKVPILGIIENMKDFLCPCCGRVEPIFPGSSPDSVESFCVARSQRFLGSIPIDTNVGHNADGGKVCDNEAIKRICASLDSLLPDNDDI